MKKIQRITSKQTALSTNHLRRIGDWVYKENRGSQLENQGTRIHGTCLVKTRAITRFVSRAHTQRAVVPRPPPSYFMTLAPILAALGMAAALNDGAFAAAASNSAARGSTRGLLQLWNGPLAGRFADPSPPPRVLTLDDPGPWSQLTGGLPRGASGTVTLPAAPTGQGLTLVPISAQFELFCRPCNPSTQLDS